jgi:hypothetical protein
VSIFELEENVIEKRWKCPRCGSSLLKVQVTADAVLHQYKGGVITEIDSAHEWDSDSCMTCTDCHFMGSAARFETGVEATIRERKTK